MKFQTRSCLCPCSVVRYELGCSLVATSQFAVSTGQQLDQWTLMLVSVHTSCEAVRILSHQQVVLGLWPRCSHTPTRLQRSPSTDSPLYNTNTAALGYKDWNVCWPRRGNYFASAAVAVDSSHMTASSSALRSRFSPPWSFVNGHVSAMLINHKSVFSLGPQLSTWHCPHSLLSAIAAEHACSWYAVPAAVDRYHQSTGHSAANPPAAVVD